VVGRADDIKGESVFAFVVLRGARPTGDTTALVTELRNWVGEQLGAIAKPDRIRFADNLPKTRSGKIMRRLLRAIANDQPITQDISTLENPGIVDQLRGMATEPAATKSAPVTAARTRKPVRRPKAKTKLKPKPKPKTKAKLKRKPKPKPRTKPKPKAKAKRKPAARSGRRR